MNNAAKLGLLALWCFAAPAWAQNCNQDFISLISQDEVDSFQDTYGPCTHVVETFSLTHPTTTTFFNDLRPLSEITSVGGDFRMQYAFINLLGGEPGGGLANLQTVGGSLQVQFVQTLTSLAEMTSLTSVGDNAEIPSGQVSITDSSLTSIGLPSLVGRLGGLTFRGNDAATDLSEWPAGITHISSLAIAKNDGLLSVSGLPAADAAQVGIVDNPQLTSLDLSGLNRIGTDGYAGELVLKKNPNLGSISLPPVSELVNLIIGDQEQMGAPLASATESPSVVPELDISALSGLIAVYGDVLIQQNPNLSDCSALARLLDDVDDGEPGPGPGPSGIPDVAGMVTIGSNGTGCNSIQEVVDSGGSDPDDPFFSDGFEDSPGS